MTRAHRRHPGRGKDKGTVTLEYVIMFPVLLSLICIGIQGALWYFARTAAQSAAQEGLRAARAQAGTNETGRQTAQNFVTEVAGGNLLDPLIQVTGEATITVKVSGLVPSFLPGLKINLAQSATGPKEKWSTP